VTWILKRRRGICFTLWPLYPLR